MFRFDLIQKCLDVIDSCKTAEQIRSAVNYTELTLKFINTNEWILDRHDYVREVSVMLNENLFRKMKKLGLVA